jgi:hypothetical protein
MSKALSNDANLYRSKLLKVYHAKLRVLLTESAVDDSQTASIAKMMQELLDVGINFNEKFADERARAAATGNGIGQLE